MTDTQEGKVPKKKADEVVTKAQEAVKNAITAKDALKKAKDALNNSDNIMKAKDAKNAVEEFENAVEKVENAVKEAENAVKEASAQVVIYIAYEYLTNNKYKNKKYVDPDKLVDKPSEKEYMEEFINYGRRAKTGITDFYENILNSIFTEEAKKFRSLEDKTELCFEKVYFSGLWKGGDMKRVHEFYVLFKDKAFEHINTSIALFISSKCESNSPVFLAIEMKDNGSKSLDYPRHNRLLHYNGESTENLYCTVTLNHSSSKHINPGLSKDTIKYVYDNNDKINNDHIKKVRLQYDINVDAPNIMEEIKKGIKELIPYYYYVVKMADKYKYQYQYNKNIILYGPPGTGKTYHTVYYAVGIIENKPYEIILSEDYEGVLRRYNNYKNERKIMFSTFHQSYSYEEFIGGIMPKLKDSSNEQSSDGKKDDNLLYELEPGKLKDSSKEQSSDEKKDNNLLYKLEPGKLKDSSKEQSSDERKDDNLLYELEPGKFKRFCDEAKDKKGNYVFIIDEINRGNISKIFGELITLIEESKRLGEKEEMKLQIPHFKDEFGVPNNVYIIGTMNTADRSIALIDTALRRRFNFVEMMPNPKIFEKKYISEEELNLDICKMLETINRRISVLYDREHTIGHAYFTSLIENPRTEQLAKIFRNSIIPLLQEYFYEDYEKIQLVLGDNKKSNADYKFIKDEKVIEKDIFKGQTDIDIAEKEYEINQKAFSNLQSYIEIYLDVSKPDVSKLDASKSEE